MIGYCLYRKSSEIKDLTRNKIKSTILAVLIFIDKSYGSQTALRVDA